MQEDGSDSDLEVPPTPSTAMRGRGMYNPFSTQSAPAERMASFPELDYEVSEEEASASAPASPLASATPQPLESAEVGCCACASSKRAVCQALAWCAVCLCILVK